jgi:hypothetical protein
VKLLKAMKKIHAQVAANSIRDCKARIQNHNDKTHGRSPNFQVGDYVLVAEIRKNATFKLQLNWKGPRRCRA